MDQTETEKNEERGPAIRVHYDATDVVLCNVREVLDTSPEYLGGISFYFRVEVAYEESSGVMTILMKVSVGAHGEESAIAEIVTRHRLSVQNMNLLESDGVYHIPRDMMAKLIHDAYSTTRGILLARGAGIVPRAIVLPIYEPADIIPFTTLCGENIALAPEEPATEDQNEVPHGLG